MSSSVLGFVFPAPPSLLLTAASVVIFASSLVLGVCEFWGHHLQYSKFRNTNPQLGGGTKVRLSGRAGMLLLYSPAFAAAAAALAVPGAAAGPRSMLVASALAIHFLKRVLEVLFVHRYSGQMSLDLSIFISFSYFSGTTGMIYAQYLTHNMAEPAVDLKFAGIVVFLIGIAGNFYHHCLLSKLRGKDDKGYKIPKGGLFGLVICPHYLFEIIDSVGISFISQTVYAFSFSLGVMFYLMGRSYATRKWYISKFENFPADVKALVPYIL